MQSLIMSRNKRTNVTKNSGNSLVGEIMCGSSQVTKKRRLANDKDHISNLPESVICHILSRLPTKDAFRTTILSKDWEYKWTSIYNIDIDDYTFRFGEPKKKREVFVDFVDKILFHSHDLKSFRLSCHRKYDRNRLTMWISTAFRRNIESFDLRLDLPKSFVLPRILNTNVSLKKLKLILPCTLRVPLGNHFPNLTDLYFEKVEILNMLSNSEPLVFSFPVLKTFDLVDCKWSNVNTVEIYSPSLRVLNCSTDRKGGIKSYSIKICGARLENFITQGGYPENFILNDSVVLKVSLENNPQNYSDPQSGLHIRKLLKGVSTVTRMMLSTSLYKAIAKSAQEFPLPRYEMLQRLFIGISENAKLLLELLHSAPSLKFLYIGQNHRGSKPFDRDEVDPVPSCVSHLEELVFSTVHEKPLFYLAMFFLKHGVELKKVSLIDYDSRKVALVEHISKFPRASTCVEIV